MSEAEATSSVNPWRALWLHPGLAVEAVLARDRRRTTLALAAVSAILALLSGTGQSVHLFALGPSVAVGLVVLFVALAGAVFGVVSLYVTGWIVNVVARAFGGRGGAAGARAALAWGSVPLLISSLVGLAASLGQAHDARASWLIVLSGVVVVICVLFGVVLQTAMLARVQKFGVARAFFSMLVGTVGVALALAFAVRTLAFQPFDLPSASMAPTLQRGDYVFVSKSAYGYSRYSFPFAPAWFEGRVFARQPKRGDVVVFANPKDGSAWVKRIVGLPGETIQMKAGRLFIDGEMVERHRVEPGFRTEGPFGDAIVAPTYDEALPGGATHRIIEIKDDHGFLDNTDVFLTPPNAYFVLGDNRDNSVDSRVPPKLGGFGFVPLENIVGRVGMIYYSFDAEPRVGPPAPRLERIGLAVE
jgi:signal peptidase I